jgi:uncharacterized membrane protein
MTERDRSRLSALREGTLTWLLAMVGALGLAGMAWQFLHREMLFDFLLHANDSRIADDQLAERHSLIVMGGIGVILATAYAVVDTFLRNRRQRPLPRAPLPLFGALVGLPALTLPTFEFEHSHLTGIIVVAISAGAAYFSGRVSRFARGDLGERAAHLGLWTGYAVFVGTIGFLSHYRYVTFHAKPYDLSYEVNAVAGILRHGLPTCSVGSEAYYAGQHIPAVYFNEHVPLVYYLYAPFLALFRDPRTVLWLQAAHMGAGGFGAYLLGRRWLGRRWTGLAMALAYWLNPSVQGHCLHDFHANSLAIPTVLLALGLMEAGHVGWAVLAAILTVLCREETAIYAAPIGLFWCFRRPVNRTRIRAGLVVIGTSGAFLLFVTGWLMPHFGGGPGLRHYVLFIDGVHRGRSLIGAYALDPIGAAEAIGHPLCVEYVWLALVPFGFVAVFGMRAAFFLLTPAVLTFSAGNLDFFIPGMNYAAPLVPAVIVMSLSGAREWLLVRRRMRLPIGPSRVALVVYVLTTAVFANYLYGNILSKTYKLEYGQMPEKRESEYEYQDRMSYVTELPPYGEREREIWEAIEKVPKAARVSASWLLNPAFSARDVAYLYPATGDGHPATDAAEYIILDKLPPDAYYAPEEEIASVRNRSGWKVFYENREAVVFERAP